MNKIKIFKDEEKNKRFKELKKDDKIKVLTEKIEEMSEGTDKNFSNFKMIFSIGITLFMVYLSLIANNNKTNLNIYSIILLVLAVLVLLTNIPKSRRYDKLKGYKIDLIMGLEPKK